MQPFLSMSSGTFTFFNGLTAQVLQVQDRTELPKGLHQIGLNTRQPVLVLVGGASNLALDDQNRLENLFIDVLAPLANQLGLTVIDGGTDAGIMQLIGRARAAIQGKFPLVGVAPVGKVQLPDQQMEVSQHQNSQHHSSQHHSLEPHHTHFVLVPGEHWGDESPWIAEIASYVAQSAPSVTILINGGAVASKDARESVAEQRLVVVIAGTGRLADRIAKAAQQPQTEAQDAWLVKSGYFQLFNLANVESELKPFLQQHFTYNGATL